MVASAAPGVASLCAAAPPVYPRTMSPATPALEMLAAAAGRAAERAAAILRDRDYQTALPAPREPTGFQLPLGPLELLLKILLWAALAVAVIIAATWIARRLGLGARDVEAPAEAASAAPAVGIRVEGAEALAAQGRFAEAIHRLLLDTLEALSRAARLAPSLTSREIVSRVPLAPAAREALAGLVDAVEVSWFGGAVPGEGDYRRCLERFRAFVAHARRAA